jgi:hypothetical protein
MRRYDIVKGDAATVGGAVRGDDATDIIGGHQFGYEHPWTRWVLLYSIVQIS